MSSIQEVLETLQAQNAAMSVALEKQIKVNEHLAATQEKIVAQLATLLGLIEGNNGVNELMKKALSATIASIDDLGRKVGDRFEALSKPAS